METASFSFRKCFVYLGLIVAVMAVPSLAAAQSGGRGQGGEPARNPAPREIPNNPSIRERQFQMMEMEREAANPRTPEEQKIALEQIADDYKQIQLVNNKMMGTAMKPGGLNYANVSQALSEIRKRANRMRNNLRLPSADPETTDGYKPAVDAAQFKSNLLALDKSIMSFVGNTIFKNPDVVNLEEAKKARGELETIIRSSQLIAKDAEVLNKSSDK